jgi:hypothetical protein
MVMPLGEDDGDEDDGENDDIFVDDCPSFPAVGVCFCLFAFLRELWLLALQLSLAL